MELRKTKKFGLVFEKHIPELLPLCKREFEAKCASLVSKVGSRTRTSSNAFVKNMRLYSENMTGTLKTR